ncbi:MAG TPA: glycosyltransferase family 4 protein [Pseudobdellovibrionaceae bacterium]|nr:glycosyltransferase family 4 protein [Pseudobdellovibrionaceae bacterium]
MNICFVAYHFSIQSRASDSGFLWPLARGLVSAGHQVTVLSARSHLKKAETTREGVHVYYLQEGKRSTSRFSFEKAAFLKFKELHNSAPFDIVHSLDSTGYRIGRLKKKLKFKMTYDVEATQLAQCFAILSMQEDTLSSFLTTFTALTYKFLTTYLGSDRFILKTADGVFVTTPQQRVALERYYLYPDFHIYSAPYGAPEALDFISSETPENLKTKFNFPQNAHILLAFSDMTYPEEIKPLLRAFEKVVLQKPNCYLVILGQGPKWKEVEFEVLSLVLGNFVRMVGSVSEEDQRSYMEMSEVFVNLSSRISGYDSLLIEAMIQKKIVIGSEMSSAAQLIEDGIEGFLIRPADVESLSSLLLAVFTGKLPVQEVGEKAAKKIKDLFDKSKMIHQVELAYKRVLEVS